MPGTVPHRLLVEREQEVRVQNGTLVLVVRVGGFVEVTVPEPLFASLYYPFPFGSVIRLEMVNNAFLW